ncbi:hypothetical protein GCM10027066_33460 [Dyella jejuensis]
MSGVASAQPLQTADLQGTSSGQTTPVTLPDATPPIAPRVADAGTNGGATVSYTYDSLGRLIQETYPAQSSSYTYDAVGNRTQAQTR